MIEIINDLSAIIVNLLQAFDAWIKAVEFSDLPYYLANAFIAYILLHTLRMIIILLRNKQLAIKSKKWSPLGIGTKRHILILGDSTAVGTGASRPEDSIAGRLARDFPDAEIINMGKNGGLISDVTEQLTSVAGSKFDLIIISAGGNDVWSFSRLKTIDRHLHHIFTTTAQMSRGNVFFLLYNNIGDAPIFPKILRFFLKRRCNTIHRHITSHAYALNIPVIKLFVKEDNNPFISTPEIYFAKDGIHPSSRGYALWYNRMWREMVHRGFKLQ